MKWNLLIRILINLGTTSTLVRRLDRPTNRIAKEGHTSHLWSIQARGLVDCEGQFVRHLAGSKEYGLTFQSWIGDARTHNIHHEFIWILLDDNIYIAQFMSRSHISHSHFCMAWTMTRYKKLYQPDLPFCILSCVHRSAFSLPASLLLPLPFASASSFPVPFQSSVSLAASHHAPCPCAANVSCFSSFLHPARLVGESQHLDQDK